MLRSSPTASRGNMRSRASSSAGASRNNNDHENEVGTGFSHAAAEDNFNSYDPKSHDDSNNTSWIEPSSNDESLTNDYSKVALHESMDEKKEEGFNNYGVSSSGVKHFKSRTVPGRATRQFRRRKLAKRSNSCDLVTSCFRAKTDKSLLANAKMIRSSSSSSSSLASLVLAVTLWYSLGVISISTSKLLLLVPSMEDVGEAAYYAHVGGVAPIVLTLQQLFLGSTFLRFLLSIQCLQSSGVQPLDYLLSDVSSASSSSSSPGASRYSHLHRQDQEDGNIFQLYWQLLKHQHTRKLCLAGLCFSMGFYCTNLGFQAASAAFVETIKASEPITSAVLAVAWGLEILNRQEVTSLALIVCGVVLSTMGNQTSPATTTDDNISSEPEGWGLAAASLLSCTIVMASNLCFSFRGLFQKLFQANKSSQNIHMDDLNLQYRMQQMGVLVFMVPAVLWEGPAVLGHIYQVSSHIGLIQSGILFRYVGLATANAVAFASYNLASTYLLSRISVVHHAALNCIRRIFAIIVTSIIFANPISATGVMGIMISFGGFMSFTHAKAQKKRGANANLLPISKAEHSHNT